MTFSPPLQSANRLPPNRALGFLFNQLVPGAGFTYIDRPYWALGWSGILLAAFVAGLWAMVGLDAGSWLLLPVVAYVAMQVQYFATYIRSHGVGRPPEALENATKWGLIAGQVGLNVFAFLLVGVLAAVLLPSLLSARTRATEAAASDYVRMVQTQAVIVDLDGQPYSGPCNLLKGHPEAPATVASCTVLPSVDGEPPQVTVRTVRGATVSSP